VPYSKAVHASVTCTRVEDKEESGHRSSFRCVANLAEDFCLFVPHLKSNLDFRDKENRGKNKETEISDRSY
jgi:hypothetical protein